MQIIKDRRALHQIPELEHDLPKTMAYLEKALTGLNCQVFRPIPSGLCAWFDFGQSSAIAFRADADALPIQEATGLSYASRHPGKMHACGHDGHMAILLELARRLSSKKSLPHNVLLVFQPAEENTGGALDICRSGVFERHHVEAIFALHIWPGLTPGEIFSRENELMSRSCEVNVDIFGRSAHIAKASQGLDALAVGLEYYRQAVRMEQEMPAEVYRLLKFGHMESGTVRNAISAHTRLEGSLRAFQDDLFEYMRDSLYKIGHRLEAETGCTVQITMSQGYPAVLNPPELYRKVRTLLPFRELEEPSMTSEDFSWYQRRLPGLFFFLGLGDTPALHSNTFCFDESILTKGADFFEKLAENYT